MIDLVLVNRWQTYPSKNTIALHPPARYVMKIDSNASKQNPKIQSSKKKEKENINLGNKSRSGCPFLWTVGCGSGQTYLKKKILSKNYKNKIKL